MRWSGGGLSLIIVIIALTTTKTLSADPPIAFVRRVSNHCLRFMAGYRVGLTSAVLEYAVKIQKP